MKIPEDTKKSYLKIYKEVYNNSGNGYIVRLLDKAGIEKEYIYQLITNKTITKTGQSYIKKFLKICSPVIKSK